MNTIMGLTPKQLVAISAIAIVGFALLPGWYKWVWFAGCVAYEAWRQRERHSKDFIQPVMTAEEILAVMTPVDVLPPRDSGDASPYSKPIRIGRLLEDGSFEMYCDEPFVRYRFLDGAYVRFGMPDRRVLFVATHWQLI